MLGPFRFSEFKSPVSLSFGCVWLWKQIERSAFSESGLDGIILPSSIEVHGPFRFSVIDFSVEVTANWTFCIQCFIKSVFLHPVQLGWLRLKLDWSDADEKSFIPWKWVVSDCYSFVCGTTEVEMLFSIEVTHLNDIWMWVKIAANSPFGIQCFIKIVFLTQFNWGIESETGLKLMQIDNWESCILYNCIAWYYYSIIRWNALYTLLFQVQFTCFDCIWNWTGRYCDFVIGSNTWLSKSHLKRAQCWCKLKKVHLKEMD
jgi:hypothetical protein